jgi:parallel beta-helix repeat protein
MKNAILTIFLMLVALATCACGAELLVPSQYRTIKSAIRYADDGDTVIVAPGTYSGPDNLYIDFLGKAITVRSIDPNDPNIVAATIIDCNGSGDYWQQVFYFHNGEDSNSILTGLTITNSYVRIMPSSTTGVIECFGSSPTISNCRIIDNTLEFGHGGGISCFNSNATITKCTITGNSATYGGGISCSQSNLMIRNCIITGNTAQVGGGIYCYNSSLTLINCTFIANSADDDGGGIYNRNSRPTITNCIFWNNIAPDGPEIYLSYDSNMLLSYTDVKGGQSAVYVEPDCTLNWGKGNIDAYPYFAFNTDYHIMPPSPCIDAGDPNYVPEPNETDLDSIPRIIGSRIDMGAYECPNTPSIAISTSKVSFSCVQDREKPQPDTLLIRNRGGRILNWRIIEDCNWLQITPTIGISTGEINEVTITVEPNGLASGTYNYDFAIQDPNAINSPVKIQVALHIGALLRVPQHFLTIQAAIDAAENQDMVLVSNGIYTGNGNRDIDFKGKAITIRSENGPDNCIIDCNSTTTESHSGFYFHGGEDANSIVAGFNIKNGFAGGGIYCQGGRAGRVSPSIIDCLITADSAEKSRGIYCFNSSPTITNCTITGNSDGGVLFQESDPKITNCTISNNNHSGIYCYNSSSTITDCTISNNNRSGIYCDNISPTIINCTITDCTITGNSADRGGGINCLGGHTTIANCIISDNKSSGSGRSGVGGGMSIIEGLCLIYNSIISGNSATWNGGGLANGGKTVITNCTFSGNSAPRSDQYGYIGYGGAISSTRETTIINCILYDNWARYGNEIALLSSKVDVNYSDVDGGQAAVFTKPDSTLIWGLGNIDADPRFVKPGYWVDANDPNIIVEPNDPNAAWLDGDYHLLPASPCINAGDPNYVPEPNETDLDGLPRIIGGRIDMGAYEFNHQPVAVAGPNQTVYAWLDGFADVTLVGSASFDDDNDVLDYYWSWTIDGNTYEANGINPTIKLPVGIHTIELVVDDGIDLSEPDYCTITVIKAVRGRLTITPRVIETRSHGKWLIATLYLPPVIGEKVNTTIPLRLYPSGIEAKYQHFYRYGRFGCSPTIALAFFDKQMVSDALGPGRFEVSVVGQFLSGRLLFGSDTIKILSPPPKPPHHRH